MAYGTEMEFNNIEVHLIEIFPGLHAKRTLSLANATLGVVSNALLAVGSIGKGLAHSRGNAGQTRDQAGGSTNMYSAASIRDG